MPRPPDTPHTGNARLRRGLFGRLVLQVEVSERRDLGPPFVWRDARSRDLWRANAIREGRGLPALPREEQQ